MEIAEMAERITTAAAEATAAVGRLNYLSTREELEEACTRARELRDAFQAAAEKLPAGSARRSFADENIGVPARTGTAVDGDNFLHMHFSSNMRRI